MNVNIMFAGDHAYAVNITQDDDAPKSYKEQSFRVETEILLALNEFEGTLKYSHKSIIETRRFEIVAAYKVEYSDKFKWVGGNRVLIPVDERVSHIDHERVLLEDVDTKMRYLVIVDHVERILELGGSCIGMTRFSKLFCGGSEYKCCVDAIGDFVDIPAVDGVPNFNLCKKGE